MLGAWLRGLNDRSEKGVCISLIGSIAAKIRPEDGETHAVLGVMLMEKNQVDEAAKEFLQATRVQPTNAVANYQLALIYQSRKETQKAIADLFPSHRLCFLLRVPGVVCCAAQQTLDYVLRITAAQQQPERPSAGLRLF